MAPYRDGTSKSPPVAKPVGEKNIRPQEMHWWIFSPTPVGFLESFGRPRVREEADGAAVPVLPCSTTVTVARAPPPGTGAPSAGAARL